MPEPADALSVIAPPASTPRPAGPKRARLAVVAALLLAGLALVGGSPLRAAESKRPTAPDLDGDALASFLRETGCPRCALTDVDLSGADLTGADFTGAELSGVDLTGAKLHRLRGDGLHIAQAQLAGADFAGASLRNLTTDCNPALVGSECDGGEDAAPPRFRNADLTGADLSGIPTADVAGARVDGATFALAFPATLMSAQFQHVRLGPDYSSQAEPATFSRAEIAQLAPHITSHTYGGRYDFDFDAPPRKAQPSFDCAKASLPTEKLICEEVSLAEQDALIASLYKTALGSGSEEIKASQRSFLAARNRCGADADCVTAALQNRVSELRVLAGAAPSRRPPQRGRYGAGEPTLPADLAGSELAKRLLPLLRNDTDYVDVEEASATRLVVSASSLGGNGHSCTMESIPFVWDAKVGGYVSADPDQDPADDEPTTLWFGGDRVTVAGGRWYCGARASLEGTYELARASSSLR